MHAISLRDAFAQLDDPRRRRGVRRPFSGMVALMLLGMPARIREMEVLVRWATTHWDQLREPLGFDRDSPPCATTISRTPAEMLCGRGCDYLLQIKANQADTLEALQSCFALAAERPPAAETIDKKGVWRMFAA